MLIDSDQFYFAFEQILSEKTGWGRNELKERVKALIKEIEKSEAPETQLADPSTKPFDLRHEVLALIKSTVKSECLREEVEYFDTPPWE